jgi:integrase
MRLTKIKPLHVTQYFSDKSEMSNSFLKRSKFLLNASFEAAIDNDLCGRNPARNIKLAMKPQTEKEVFTDDETRAIIEFAKTDRLFGVPIYIMFNTGIRSGEMRGMTTEQLDFTKGFIKIDRAIKHTEEIGLPKNNKTRYVPLDDEVIEFLSANIDMSVKYLVGNKHYVSRAGFRSRYQHFFNRLNKHLADNGKEPISYKSAHSTRHTFASIRQKNGMPVAILMEIMGHSSREMTDHYTHVGDIATLSEAVRKYRFLDESA